MNLSSALGFIVSITLLNSCAPVASSSPKQRIQRDGDVGIVTNSKSSPERTDILRVDNSGVIVSSTDADEYLKKLKGFNLVVYLEAGNELYKIKKDHSLSERKFATEMKRTEFKTVFIVDAPASLIGSDDSVKAVWSHTEVSSDQFKLDINLTEASEKNRDLISKKLVRVVVAHKTVENSNRVND